MTFPGDSAYPDYNPYEMGNYVYYSDGGSYYALTNESQIFALTEELKPLFEAIDQNKIDGIRDNAQYSLDDGLLIEIMEHYGNYGGGQVEEKGEWSISEDGVLMGYSGGSTPKSLSHLQRRRRYRIISFYPTALKSSLCIRA